MKRKLLITGAAGTIGKVTYEGLKRGGKYVITAADLKRDDEAGIVKMDIHDAARLDELTRGVDTVLHFAWIKDEGDFLGKVLSGNVSGAYKLYEAAVQNGVRRLTGALYYTILHKYLNCSLLGTLFCS
ncbi:nucleoside-diphosphate-sugar epimerase [Paenibacillus brasilensis]|uniref:Nucleoside-diphosphate-sugar epimerase n=1 Tax=Paenibacillus brasilensis TaxID=128574 RepID=A0ABU0KUS1_9BACL|nr:NAD-dependent epimerase/dehydratase family protein [Paenibacillus brasilensis]MDQ0493183.1 nucleoside-diphosphate-sugar epimerase [Paenibacillus brasilensis]